MALPGLTEWGLGEIEALDPDRAAYPRRDIDANELKNQIASAFANSLKNGTAKYGVDFHTKRQTERRAIIQFEVGTVLFDQFYNGRTGYRAHYWVSPEIGDTFDEKLGDLLRAAISEHMPTTAEGRLVRVEITGYRDESDRGPYQLTREFALQSLAPEASKLWRCEWLITDTLGLNKSQQTGAIEPKLQIGKWEGEGLYAPRGSRLDFKGGFVGDDGAVTPTKNRKDRAMKLHQTGWTGAI
jgi:hypothetical protein